MPLLSTISRMLMGLDSTPRLCLPRVIQYPIIPPCLAHPIGAPGQKFSARIHVQCITDRKKKKPRRVARRVPYVVAAWHISQILAIGSASSDDAVRSREHRIRSCNQAELQRSCSSSFPAGARGLADSHRQGHTEPGCFDCNRLCTHARSSIS